MKEVNIGNLEFYNEIEIGDLQLDIKNVYPALENLEITPRAFEQKFNHPNSYGYDEITVNPIDINLQNKEVTPIVEEQTITPDSEYDGLSSVKVNAVTSTIDANITPNNIKENISILGVIGTVKTLISSEVTITPSFEQQIITPTDGSNGIVKAIVNPIVLNTQDKTVVPSSEQQIITKDDEYDALGTVTVEPIALKDIEITQNGVYKIPIDADGYGIITVNVNGGTSGLTTEQIEALNNMKVSIVNGNLIFDYDDEILKLDFNLENDDLIVENNLNGLDFNINKNGELEAIY